MVTEKDRRVYYQDLVHKACNLLDELLANTQRHGDKIVCGSADAPTAQFADALNRLRNKWNAREAILKDYQAEFQSRQMDDVANSNIGVIRDIHEKTLRAIASMCSESLGAHPHYPETYPAKLAILEKTKQDQQGDQP